MSNRTGMVKGLAHIGVFTQDMDKSISFYRDVLGFSLANTEKLAGEEGTTHLAFLAAGDCVLELIQPANLDGIKDRQHGLVDHIALQVTGLEDLIDRLRAHECQFESEEPVQVKIMGGVKIIFFAGPNGERLELFEKLT